MNAFLRSSQLLALLPIELLTLSVLLLEDLLPHVRDFERHFGVLLLELKFPLQEQLLPLVTHLAHVLLHLLAHHYGKLLRSLNLAGELLFSRHVGLYLAL